MKTRLKFRLQAVRFLDRLKAELQTCPEEKLCSTDIQKSPLHSF